MQAKPYFIRRVEDYDRIKKEESKPQTRQVLSPEIAETMLDLLQEVVQNGTATAAKSLGRPLGGKTGTTDNFTDAWFVGFNPSLTAAVWVGFDGKKTLGEQTVRSRRRSAHLDRMHAGHPERQAGRAIPNRTPDRNYE